MINSVTHFEIFSEEPAEVSASAFDEEYRTKVHYSGEAEDGELLTRVTAPGPSEETQV
jgi:hypothetical protein